MPKAQHLALEKKLHERSELTERGGCLQMGFVNASTLIRDYLKEMVGNKIVRKWGGSGMKFICELSP